MLSRFPTYAIAALILCLPGIKAGPGANIFACLSTQHASPPLTFPLDISFGLGDTECMNHKGHHATVTATEPGHTCADIGYVEAKKSGLCFLGASIWKLAYATSNGTVGRLITKWGSETRNIEKHGRWARGRMNVMEILGGSDHDVSACPSEDVCGDAFGARKGFVWDAGTQGPIYVIFEA